MAGLPTIILMGERFTTTDDPWVQALQHLDLHNMSSEQFVGALEAAAQTAHTRALVIVDAINEGHGIDTWPKHLPSFLSRLRLSKWIGLVVSVRSTYTGVVVPSHLLRNAVVAEHRGFAGQEYEAAKIFFAHYDLEFPSAPILYPEFSTPLFLKTICEGLSDTPEKRLPQGAQGIVAIFELYLGGINRRVAQRIDYNPSDNHVREALGRIARRLFEIEQYVLPRTEAEEIVNDVLPDQPYSRSLFLSLVSEGVLFRELREGGEVVRLTYERFADHIIAEHLLEEHVDCERPAAAFREGGGLASLPGEPKWTGVIEALCIQLPERCGQELMLVVPEMKDHFNGEHAFLQSIVWRDVNAVSADTLTVLGELGARGLDLGDMYETLLVVATIPDHPFNGKFLDRHLRQYAMPDRDARWSIYLHYAYGQEGALDRLLDWTSAMRPSGRMQLDEDVVDLAAITLTWVLTTSNRFVRDRATKALVALLGGRLSTTAKLVERFRDVDDWYLVERTYALAYGAAMCNYEVDAAGQLATLVYESVFSSGQPPPHILLREYARGVIERALFLGSSVEVDEEKVRPPYRSDWPRIVDEAEMDLLTPKWRASDLMPGDDEHARNRIRSSIMADDFARYVIGTNSGATDWLSLMRG